MTPVLFLLWIILCERISLDMGMLQVVVIGIIVTALVRLFMAKALDLTLRAELLFYRRLGYIFLYVCVLVREILKANFIVLGILLFRPRSIRPTVVKFRVPLHDDLARTLLSCGITLTPGTVTIDVEKDLYTVHCLDSSLAEGIETGTFVRILKKMDKQTAKKATSVHTDPVPPPTEASEKGENES